MPAQRHYWVTNLGRVGRFVYQGHPDAAFQVDDAVCKRYGMMPPFPYPQPPPPKVEPDYEAEEIAMETAAKAVHTPPADKAVHAPPENKTLKISPPPTRPRRKR